MSEEAQQGHITSENKMLHDLEAEYVVRNIDKEDAQLILNDLPEHYYVIDKWYDSVKRRMEFTIMLDDVAPIEISDHYDYMEENHPECRKRFDQLHDFRTGFDDADLDSYNDDATDYTQFIDRTLP
jgi:hypothetical protein